MAMHFASGVPRIDLGSLSGLSGATALTFATWVKFAATSADATIVMRGTFFSTSAPWLLWRDDIAAISGRANTLSAVLNTNAGLLRVESAADVLNDTTSWHHVALVFEAGVSDGLRIYVDGVRDANVASAVGHTSIVANTSSVTAGTNDATRAFTGDMAELAFWGAVLSDGEIAVLAAGGTPLMHRQQLASLVAYHDLIRDTNRPGIGQVATSYGTFAPAAHPRVLLAHGATPVVGRSAELTPHPYHTAAGDPRNTGDQAGQAAIAGANAGTLFPNF